MKTFSELQEAKANPSLTRTVPAAPGERAFLEKHMHVHDILKAFRDAKCDKTFFNGTTKEFPRKKNRFGRNEKESITAYEGVEETGEVLAEAGKKGAKRHIFVNGKYVGTTAWAKTNKEALKNYRNVHPDVHGIAAKVAAEGVEVNEISKGTLKKFSDSDKYMKKDDSKIDSKDDKGTKVKTFINDLRKKRK